MPGDFYAVIHDQEEYFKVLLLQVRIPVKGGGWVEIGGSRILAGNCPETLARFPHYSQPLVTPEERLSILPDGFFDQPQKMQVAPTLHVIRMLDAMNIKIVED